MSNWKTIAGMAALACAIAAPAWAEESTKPASGSETGKPAPGGASAVLKDQKGAVVGTVTLTPGGSGIAMTGKLTGLTAGSHGFHIHEKGVCEGDFATAGGHFNPGHAKHGILNDAGRHAGDLPNIEASASGEATVDMFLTGVSLKPGADNSLADEDGTSFVVHAGPDDYKSDPSGNSGGRVACGVLELATPAAASE
ncbi:superoxide dismutase family protein [Emcibacter sp. SYSU 3D8]|uniref:superoxide dismutase family protein n=1 Tax=Emcibacter sp. SYSU 3D8 TaxID=3133969 RepID=UPI0031FE9A18